jgi:fatty-acyl-CoA synthase
MTRATFTEVLLQSCREAPQRAAVTLLYNQRPEETITFEGLIQGSARYAQALAASGVQPGEVTILIFNHGPDLVYSFFGSILHGAVPSIMPFLTEKLSPEQYRSALKSLFEITAPAAVLTYPEFLGEVETARVGSSVRIVLNSEQVMRNPVAEILTAAFEGQKRQPEDIVLLQHSSGTTGLQKGVALSHQAVFNQIESYSRALRLNSSDVVVSWLPLYHDMGLIAGFLMPILQRVPLVLISPFDWVRAPYRLLQAVHTFRGTLTWLPNFAYNFCAKKIRDRDLQGIDLSSWRAVINCSEPMAWKSHQMFLERFQGYGLRPESLATCYAMAENVFAVTQGGIDAPLKIDWVDPRALMEKQIAAPVKNNPGEQADPLQNRAMLSAGKPIDNTRVRIVDAQGNDLPERYLGEIAIQSDCMLTGYFHRPDLTEQAFNQGWYLTGDLGYVADGEVYVTGRKKDLIIVGGKNIYPQDLERLVDGVTGIHPGRVVAFGVFNEDTGTEDVVIVAEVENTDGEVNALAERNIQIANDIRLRVNQGSDIALRQIELVPRNWLLKTSSGKIARNANRDKWLAQQNSGANWAG